MKTIITNFGKINREELTMKRIKDEISILKIVIKQSLIKKMREIFSKFCEIESIKIIIDENKNSKHQKINCNFDSLLTALCFIFNVTSNK